MKVLITGGAGFLGYHLAQYLNNKNFNITLLDIAHFDKSEYKGNFRFIQSDIRNKKQVDNAVTTQDIVVHAAAALPLWKKEDIYAVNIEGTKNLLESALKNKVKRFIYISSTAVYGVPKVHPIYENAELVGVGAYGESKIKAEKLCRDYLKKGLNVTIIRPKTFVGTARLGVFEILFDWIHDGKRIPIIGSGNNRYQLLDVEDLVEAIYLFMIKDDKKYNDVFNIGAKNFRTVKEDLGALFDYAFKCKVNKKSRVFPIPAFLVKKPLWLFEKLGLSPLYQWVYDTADKDSFVSIDRLIDTLHWSPKYSNSQALIKSYQWYLDNYQEIKSRPAGVTHTVGWKQGILGLFKRFL